MIWYFYQRWQNKEDFINRNISELVSQTNNNITRLSPPNYGYSAGLFEEAYIAALTNGVDAFFPIRIRGSDYFQDAM